MNEWKLKLKFLVGKNITAFFFWLKRFYRVSQLRYFKEERWKRLLLLLFFIHLIYSEYVNFIQQIIENFYCTITSTYTSLNVGMELSIWQGNEHVYSCSALNSVLLLPEQYGCPNTSTPKNDFPLNTVFL